jgi:diketogulonate reductase-like aldo/keto reductase
MNTKPFGKTGAAVSVIGQGTWYLDHGDRKRAITALQRGLDLGMTHIDTAEMYGDAELKGAAKQRFARRNHHRL